VKLFPTTRLLAAALLLSGLVCAAEKDKPLPKGLPPYGPLEPFVPPGVNELKLDNGLTVRLAPVSGFPKVAMAYAARGGYAADPAELPGVSDLLADAVTQGTAHRTARQIAEELQGCGGDVQSAASSDYLLLQTSVLSEKAAPALSVLADIIRNASFPDAEVGIVKQRDAAQLESMEAQSSFVARRALRRAMFGSHPYAIIAPTKESIAKTTAADLKREYQRRFRPSHSVLVIVGDFDRKAMEAAIRNELNSWSDPATPGVSDVPKPAPTRSNTVFYAARPNSVQTTFSLGALGPSRTDSDADAAELADSIYGGMFGSRLVLNIREDKGYTYSPRSSLSPLKQAGVLVTHADVRNAVTGASYNEISYELNRMATTEPDKEEVDRAKRYAIGSLAVFLQPQASLASELANYWIDSLTPKDLAAKGDKILKTSPEQIEEAGRKYFPMSRMTVVTVGDENVIKTQLAPFGVEFQKVQ
jgi:zinc protease